MSDHNFHQAFHEAKPALPEAPLPLFRDMPPGPAFPVSALPPSLTAATRAIVAKVRVPHAIAAQSLLGVAALATQSLADVILPFGQSRPLSSYFLTIARSGERKTSADYEAMHAVRQRETELKNTYDPAYAEWLIRQQAYEAQVRQIRQDKANYPTQREKIDAITALTPLPPAPMTPLLTCAEPTYEGLCRNFMIGHPSVGIFSSEGGQFINGHGMTPENKTRTAAALSELWDGLPIRRVRSGDGVMILYGRRISIHLMAQPEVASLLLTDRSLKDQGILSRFLVCQPESLMGQRYTHNRPDYHQADIDAFSTRILALLRMPQPIHETEHNRLHPPLIALQPDAQESFHHFGNEIEAELNLSGAYTRISGLANKAPEMACRLAAVFTLLDDAEAQTISLLHIQQATELLRFYLAEGLRLTDQQHLSLQTQQAEMLRQWLLQDYGAALISLPDIYQFGPNSIRDKTTAHKLVQLLEEHRWLVKHDGPATIHGHRRREVWRIIQPDGNPVPNRSI